MVKTVFHTNWWQLLQEWEWEETDPRKEKDSKTEELNIYRNMEHCHRSLWTTYIIKFVLEHPLNPLQRHQQCDSGSNSRNAMHVIHATTKLLEHFTIYLSSSRQGWRKCCSAVALLRAEQGPCEPSKGFVSKSAERARETQTESERARVILLSSFHIANGKTNCDMIN